MFAAVKPQLLPLDVPTLAFVAVCIAALLGLLLLFAWVQQRNVRALAWWGSAYLIGASSIALRPHHLRHATRIVAVGLVDLRLQHRPHMPRLDTDHRQARFGQSTEQPLRQRSRFQPDPLEVV